MTEEQREDLMVEWSLYGLERRKVIIAEFLMTCDGTYRQEEWLNFLKEKLNIESYWKTVGLM